MQKSRLISILKTFSKKEIREFRKWVNSPAHNLREDVVLLFEYLMEDRHLHKDELLSKEYVFRKVLPKERFDDAKIRQAMHFLMKAVEEFLIFQELLEDNVRAKRTLASVYRKRKLEKSFQKNIKLVQQLQEQHPYRNSGYFRNDYLIQQEQYIYLSKLQRTTKLNLQDVSDSLDLTFLTDKLRQSSFMLSHQRVYKTKYNIGLFEKVLEYVRSKELLDIPAVAIYYYCCMSLLEKDDETHFQNLKKEIQQHGEYFPLAEIRDIYLLAINYCIGRMNIGHKAFFREAFELYRLGFEEKVLLENETVSRWTFLNVVAIAIRLEEFEWAENFVTDYQKYLEEKYRESVGNFSLARLNYEKGDYAVAMRLCNQVESDDILMNLSTRTMLFKMFYEEGEHDSLESLLESVRNYLQRKEIMGYHKTNYKNIIRFTKKLLKVNPYSQTQKDKLKTEIEMTEPLTERSWLLTQLAKL